MSRTKNSSTSSPKLPRQERRDQLLTVAMSIVRDHGTDALTLARLADEAGVSKPVAYDHFGSRSGLLIALYERIDEQQISALEDALASARRSFEEVARVISHTFMACYHSVGPEWHAISAALRGDAEMGAFHKKAADRYARLYQDAFGPFTGASSATLHLRCKALIGAGEVIANEMLEKRIGVRAASKAFHSLIHAWVRAPDR